jgi:uncharacterized protein (TIGR00369 family)
VYRHLQPIKEQGTDMAAPYADSPGRWKAVLMQDGRAEMSWTPTPDMANPFGSVHGGIIATVIDEVTGAALMSTIEAGSAPTVSMNVEYLHAVPIGGTYTAVGEIVRMGRALAIVDARIVNEEGTVLARGTCIYQIPRPK